MVKMGVPVTPSDDPSPNSFTVPFTVARYPYSGAVSPPPVHVLQIPRLPKARPGIGVIQAEAETVTIGVGIFAAQDLEARFVARTNVQKAMEGVLFGVLECDYAIVIEEESSSIVNVDY